MDDEYTAEHIHQALAGDERVNEPELRVKVVAGRVVITGDIHTPERRDAVAAVVREVDPDLVVDNQTTVMGPAPQTELTVEHIEGLV
ncbi:MAG TPA: BON domain-containing protein [Actinomycetota bacterium]|jgi:osmotically-inducible protein OsmY|nr:BON domain-containing protein [Actinomycetota bacterium]